MRSRGQDLDPADRLGSPGSGARSLRMVINTRAGAMAVCLLHAAQHCARSHGLPTMFSEVHIIVPFLQMRELRLGHVNRPAGLSVCHALSSALSSGTDGSLDPEQ